MLGVEGLAAIGQRIAELPVQVQLFFEPDRGGHDERPEAAWSNSEVGLENSLELEQWLIVEADVRQVGRGDPASPEAVFGGAGWKRSVALLPRM
jgi:hypothetical protein